MRERGAVGKSGFYHIATSVFPSSGANAAAIQAQVDAFRADLGALNPNVAGSAGSGRREINWDGVPDSLAAPNLLPANFFNVNSPRGSVFSDVNAADLTSIEYFDAANNSLGSFFAPIFGGKEALSFLGVSFDNSVVSRVRITSGNQLLTAGNIALDLVVMDDFIYGEPVAVPEPASLALFGISVAGLCAVARRRRMG